ncbi:37 kDa salivary gland allergen Aed a 2-like isoform X2 [Uranotaenia lowii]|uniref:37 kDa salivary gland allergen Aed a 2-like isoform X2 n=1 Tax=Uranotaenia lowii TaxID=190385 RepID=UPI0024799DA1|nr:37 kDa salivary gland allergen Aed a 2-like isoform X2 [Uranotaenia lowii]
MQQSQFRAIVVVVILFCLSLQTHLGKSDFTLGETFDPEETAFEFTRCIEDNAAGDGKDGLRKRRIDRWLSWELEEGDADTQRFVDCLLRKLQLFGEKFKIEYLYYQYEFFMMYTNKSMEFPSDDWNRANMGADSEEPYEIYTRIISPHKDAFRTIYFLDKELSSHAYENYTIKQPNQSIFQFCEQRYYSHNLKLTCDARNYSILQDEQFPRLMHCIFLGLRYINRSGNLDVNEIARDFHQIGVYHLDDLIEKQLYNCSNPSLEAHLQTLEYYLCLLNSSFVEDFKNALDYREVRSMNYDYAFADPLPTYDRSTVQRKVTEIHREICER